ncbi:hypothetical protein [Legionella cardiaca]|uniref:Substrate of the Dot/Icm secretion system n=1 Tax=Legionella cardiaca TaxID=1071983 RepID=A0ABY8AWC0_9GAMM|nr:hypothetical protein [Legionella cardiaca]WED43731.1 hypothetical protein PXX05_02840 [Legionella cardiaca]
MPSDSEVILRGKELGSAFKFAFASFLTNPTNEINRDCLARIAGEICSYAGQTTRSIAADDFIGPIVDLLAEQFPKSLKLSTQTFHHLDTFTSSLPEEEEREKRIGFHALSIMKNIYISKMRVPVAEERVWVQLLLLQRTIATLTPTKQQTLQENYQRLHDLIETHFNLPIAEQKTNAKQFHSDVKVICADIRNHFASNVSIIKSLVNLLHALGELIAFYSTYLLTKTNDRDTFFANAASKQIAKLNEQVNSQGDNKSETSPVVDEPEDGDPEVGDLDEKPYNMV